MKLEEWCNRWKIPKEAILELRNIIGLYSKDNTNEEKIESEAAVLNKVRLKASQLGYRLWRNNIGAVHTNEGNFIRFGLANESSAMNKVIKSSDLIGINPILITKEMVGLTLGQFVCREIKNRNWKYKDTEREKAQLRWIMLINSLGGNACFINEEGKLL